MGTRRASPAICAIAAIVLATVGCDDTQPESVSSTTASLSFRAIADVEAQHCWEQWFDEDGNGVPDVKLDFGTCESQGPSTKNTRPVPWHYSVQILILRAGETVPEVLASSVEVGDTISDFISFTPYDPAEIPIADRPPDGQIFYLNGFEAWTGNQRYQQAIGNDFGTPNVLGHTPAFEFELAPGDTVIVNARKASTVESNYLQVPPDESDLNLRVIAELTVGGSEAQVQGNLVTGSDDKAGMSFSYTRR